MASATFREGVSKHEEDFSSQTTVFHHGCVIFGLTALILYYFASWVQWTVRRQQFATFSREKGCDGPPQITSSLIRDTQHKWKRLHQRGDIFNDYITMSSKRTDPHTPSSSLLPVKSRPFTRSSPRTSGPCCRRSSFTTIAPELCRMLSIRSWDRACSLRTVRLGRIAEVW